MNSAPADRSRFDAVAREYDAGRPGYPPELFDAIEDLSGMFFRAAKVADIGAGTGKSTRAMQARGAWLVAVDHGVQMLEVLRSRTPAVPVVLADANALPFADGSLDLVTFAQSWHWVDLSRAPADVVRVVRPGGAIAMWWNFAEPRGEAWLEGHRERLSAVGHQQISEHVDFSWRAIRHEFADLDVATTRVRWERTVPKDVILDEARSKSYVVALGEEGVRAFIDRERELLPDGELREPFVTDLAVVRVPA
jgi:ubiquinone/menaquinone biosynthesis C-methylase UbiE